MRMSYGQKQALMKSGGYNGNSPFYNNNPEFQFLKPLETYEHLKAIPNFRFPGDKHQDELELDPIENEINKTLEILKLERIKKLREVKRFERK